MRPVNGGAPTRGLILCGPILAGLAPDVSVTWLHLAAESCRPQRRPGMNRDGSLSTLPQIQVGTIASPKMLRRSVKFLFFYLFASLVWSEGSIW